MNKKYIILCLVISILLITTIVFFDHKNNTNKITVAEVTHSVFYAPWYVALENNYFKDEGIDLELILTPGADKVTAAVLSGDVQIGLCGTEAAMYVYNNGEEDYIQSFAGLTKRDGQFIVSRYKIDNFSLEDLYNKEILVGRTGGMPALSFVNGLKNNNILENKINLNYSIDFASLSGAFIGGQGDFVNLFEPNASKLENEGFGYIVGSVGLFSGEVPYTTFNSRKSFITNNKDLIKKFNSALDKGLLYTNSHSSKEIASVIKNQFPDSSISELESIIQRYKDSDTWLSNTYISNDSFNNLNDILISNKLINKTIPYNDLVVNFNEESHRS